VDHVRSSGVGASIAADQETVRDFASRALTSAEVRSGSVTADRTAALSAQLAAFSTAHGYLAASLFAANGDVIGSGTGSSLGTALPVTDVSVRRALAPGSPPSIVSRDPDTTESPAVLIEPFAIRAPDDVGFVLLLQRDATPFVAATDGVLLELALLGAGLAIGLGVLLRAIFAAASTRLKRQEEALVEARRRDALTGLLNHGAAVALLTQLLEAARVTDRAVGIALVDIDNFRLLNDVHGSDVGDDVLLNVASALRSEAADWTALARYGPDEFMVIADGPAARPLAAAIKRVRTALDAIVIDLPGGERLPISVSVGITFFPFHASSVIELVSAASMALGEAKAAGGNRTEIADAWTTEPRAPHTTFDVFQGLVLAIDRKDRYTKLHSEDVACYADFLARRIDFDPDLLPALRTAGLLHDVGKIGVPDDILRKPGQLTPYEYEIVKHHVTLGDLIVRDLPDLEIVRAGVRHHHERWDGGGYMDRLVGEQIPLIARILAIADAFSAMTTTRPYRKALSVEQALEELRAAAGTQLDARLVESFVTGIETDPAAPMPGSDRNSLALWTPEPIGRAA
jgi:diguanylate cyclase (GGDEF)-like protein